MFFDPPVLPDADALPPLAFADFSHQLRWRGLVAADDYWMGLFENA